MNLKDIAADFLAKASSGKASEAFELYVRDDFIHHNPYFKGDRLSLLTAMEENAQRSPEKVFEIKRILQDGDFTVVHSFVRQKPEDRGAAVVHIFRFFEGKIAELWDLGMPVPENVLNENGIF